MPPLAHFGLRRDVQTPLRHLTVSLCSCWLVVGALPQLFTFFVFYEFKPQHYNTQCESRTRLVLELIIWCVACKYGGHAQFACRPARGELVESFALVAFYWDVPLPAHVVVVVCLDMPPAGYRIAVVIISGR